MSDTEKGASEINRDKVYPVLPLRDIVVFPGMIVPLFVGREKSVKALEEVMRDDKHILVVTKNANLPKNSCKLVGSVDQIGPLAWEPPVSPPLATEFGMQHLHHVRLAWLPKP